MRHAPAAQEDILATLLDCMGQKNPLFGTSVFDLAEDMPRERTTMAFGVLDAYPPVPLAGNVAYLYTKLESNRHNNVLLEYRYVGNRHTLMDKANREAYDAVIPLYDSFY